MKRPTKFKYAVAASYAFMGVSWLVGHHKRGGRKAYDVGLLGDRTEKSWLGYFIDDLFSGASIILRGGKEERYDA